MPEEPPGEFLWYLEMALPLFERYAFRWIAIDGRRILDDRSAIDNVVVADGDTLGEVAEIARHRFDPLLLFYAFVDPPLDPIERQSRNSFA
jgi:hypothetical protein